MSMFKTFLRSLKKNQHTLLGGPILQGMVAIGFSIPMPRDGGPVRVLGLIAVVVGVVLLVLARRVDEVLHGEVVGLDKQYELTDVQPHMHCTPELSQAG